MQKHDSILQQENMTQRSSSQECKPQRDSLQQLNNIARQGKAPPLDWLSQQEDFPASINANLGLYKTFSASCQAVTMTILECLSDGLGLYGKDRLEEFHRDGEPSATNTMFLRYPKQKRYDRNGGQNKHTDIGTLTLLFCKQEGLQALDPETETWAVVKPRAGHAIVNVGDALRFLSGFQLKSALHRVVPTPCLENRFSVAHFLRPKDTTIFVDSQGRETSAVEWHNRKHETFKSSHEKQQDLELILTGGIQMRPDRYSIITNT
jgi:isopenicillin N synthase-like dioxygenase